MTLAEKAGRYRILSRIATGGMGEVYRAQMETADGFGRQVALKVVRQDYATDASFDDLFMQEARVAMSLSHANVVQSFDAGKIDARWFLAMEYVDGTNLALLLKACHERLRQPVPQRHALFITVEALKGLDYAHRRKDSSGRPLSIVHRDISPANLLISLEGEVKIADFGIATSALRGHPQEETVKGKLPYISPEQLLGGAVDRRADLYSMGAVLYEMLTTQRLVDATMGHAVIPDILASNFPRPGGVRSEVPEELERITLRAIAREPSDRYPNAAAMRQDLEAFAMQNAYLLSSADLAEFVREVIRPKSTIPPTKRRTTGQFDADWTPELTSKGDAPFDALLGAALERVGSTETFDVFTAREWNAPAEMHPPDSPELAGRPDVAAPKNRYSRVGWIVATVTLVLGLGTIAAALYYSQRPTDASTDEPAVDGGFDAAFPVQTTQWSDAGSPSDAGLVVAETELTPVTQLNTDAGTSELPTPRRELAYLSAITEPWSFVTIDGRRLRATPIIRHPLSPGSHVVVFRNPVLGAEHRMVVQLRNGEHRRVNVDLTRGGRRRLNKRR